MTLIQFVKQRDRLFTEMILLIRDLLALLLDLIGILQPNSKAMGMHPRLLHVLHSVY